MDRSISDSNNFSRDASASGVESDIVIPDGESEQDLHRQPTVRTKPNSFSLLNCFRLSADEQQRKDRHEQVMAALKVHAAVEENLDRINKRLDKVIDVLTVATGGGQKSLLIEAVDQALASNAAHQAHIATLSQTCVGGILTGEQISSFDRSKQHSNTKYVAALNLVNSTENWSADVASKLREFKASHEKVKHLHNNFLVIHPEILGGRSRNVQVDGGESSSESDSGNDSESD